MNVKKIVKREKEEKLGKHTGNVLQRAIVPTRQGTRARTLPADINGNTKQT